MVTVRSQHQKHLLQQIADVLWTSLTFLSSGNFMSNLSAIHELPPLTGIY